MGLLTPPILTGPTMSATATAAVVLALFAFGCPPEPPSDIRYQDQLVSDGGAPDIIDVGDVEAVVLPTIDGTWLLYSQLATCVSVLTTLQEGVSRILYLVETTQTEHRVVTETWYACTQELFPVLNIQTYVTQALLDSTYPVVTTDGYVTTTEIGGAYVSGLIPEVWGVDFDDPIGDAFPESADDARIVDADGDGNPGISLLVGDLCRRYLAQRAFTAFAGRYVAPDRMEGDAISNFESITLGGSSEFCATTYQTRPNDARSTFSRVRVDGLGGSIDLDANDDGLITCDEVVPYTEILFDKMLADDANCDPSVAGD